MECLKKNIWHPERFARNAVHVLRKYWESRRHSAYQFSFDDVLLYWRERNWGLPRLDILRQYGQFHQCCIGDVRFYWPRSLGSESLPWLFNEVFRDPGYNPSSYSHNSAAIPRNGWVIDGGACEGFFSFFAFRQGAAHVVAVEPLSILCSGLEMTFVERRAARAFAVVSAALGRERGTSALNWNPDHPWDAHLSCEADNESKKQVETVTIDEVVELQKLRGPGFIKLDVEGAEMDALKGSADTLARLKPNLAIAVYHKYGNARECAAIIKDTQPDYQIEFRGMYGWFDGPPRPHLLFAW
jgi:FkbM family methyltransferase